MKTLNDWSLTLSTVHRDQALRWLFLLVGMLIVMSSMLFPHLALAGTFSPDKFDVVSGNSDTSGIVKVVWDWVTWCSNIALAIAIIVVLFGHFMGLGDRAIKVFLVVGIFALFGSSIGQWMLTQAGINLYQGA